MTITTYVNDSEEHVLDKTLTKINENISVILKDDTNVLNPTIITSGNISHTFNYIYISDFNRYYYVKNITYSQQRYYIECAVDVLMSFNSDIKSLNVIANRSSSYYNVYQTDSSIPFENRNVISTQPFSGGFNGQSMLLAVNGGY